MTEQVKTSKKKIKEYWYSRLRKMGKIKTITRADFIKQDYCFACLRQRSFRMERAHILARWRGGPDNPENLHLLCSACHYQSEAYDGERYWVWFKKQNAFHSGLYYTVRHSGEATQEIFNIFIKDAFEKYMLEHFGPDIDFEFDSNGIGDIANLFRNLYRRDFDRKANDIKSDDIEKYLK